MNTFGQGYAVRPQRTAEDREPTVARGMPRCVLVGRPPPALARFRTELSITAPPMGDGEQCVRPSNTMETF